MNKFFRTIEEILVDWGRKQRQLPSRGETLRSEILARLPSALPQTLSRPQRWPWFTFAFSGLALISLFINYLPFSYREFYPRQLPTGIYKDTKPLNNFSVNEREYSPYPRPDSGIPITDTREFLKTDYYAIIHTRKAEELVYRIKLIVRESFDGRVDSSNSSKRSGYVSFIVPANKFEDFRWMMKDLAGERFLMENIYTENLLPQKQTIEQQKKNMEETATQLKQGRNQLNSSHKLIVASIQSKIDRIEKDLTALKIKLDVTSDPAKREALKAQEKDLLTEKAGRENELSNENSIYTKKFNSLNVQISDNEVALASLTKQDQDLIDTVATVRGTIYLNWISIWEVVRLYVPINLGFLLFGAAAIVAYFIQHRKPRLLLPN